MFFHRKRTGCFLSFVSLAILFSFSAFVQAMPGDLDSTFNGNGMRIDGFGRGSDEIHAVAIQTDGNIVVAGRASIGASYPAAVARYNSDGSLDLSFNGTGKVSLPNAMIAASAVKIQADGKIVVGGRIMNGLYSDFAVVRLNPNGTFDDTFGSNGIVSTSINTRHDIVYGLDIHSDGKIVAAGSSEDPNLSGFLIFALARYNTDGSLDTSFGTGGTTTTHLPSNSSAYATAIQPDGKIVAAGSGSNLAAFVRYNADGTPDTSFDGDGIVSISGYSANAVVLQSDNKIVAAGHNNFNNENYAVIRLNTNGALDTTFDGDGIALAPDNLGSDRALAVALGTGGKIIASGQQTGFVSVRFNSDGSLDTGFGSGGVVSTPFAGGTVYGRAAMVQTDGKLIVAGNIDYSSDGIDFALARYNIDGSLDTSFGTSGKVLSDIGEGLVFTTATIVQPDGKVLASGHHVGQGSFQANYDFAVFRYEADGSLDQSFDGDGKASIGPFDNTDDYATSMVLQPDGKIIVAGYISNGSAFSLIRLNSDGSLDTGFGVDGNVLTNVTTDQDFGRSVALQPDGKIVLAGHSGSGSSIDFSVVRYLSDGSLDTSFNGNGIVVTDVGGASDRAYSVLVQTDGKIVLVGYSDVSGDANFALVRYNPDGSLDSSFGTNGKVLTLVGTNSPAFAATLQADGKILAGGSSFDSTWDFSVARYNPNGTLDTGFGLDGFVVVPINNNDQINAMAVQPNGKIVATGHASNLSLNSRDFATIRLNSDGSLDNTWGNAGKLITDLSGREDRATAIALDDLGRVIVAGYANGLSSVIRLVGDNPVPGPNTQFDFDGDGKTDPSIFRPSAGQWWYLRSSDFGNAAFNFGTSTDTLTPADFTGDGKTDIAFFRPATGEWFVLRSEDNSFYSVPFGTNGDIPAPGDFDGDGMADTAVFRPSTATWFIQRSSDNGTTIQGFGTNGDKPTVKDFDGDGKDDIAIFRPSNSQWWQLRSTAGVVAYQFGTAGDKTVPGDYTGDGKADVAFFRPSNGNWFVLRSEDNSFYSVPFGVSTDIPTPGDYDGDGKTDTAVFRPSDNNWYVQGSTSGFFQIGFGQTGDIPVPNAYVAP